MLRKVLFSLNYAVQKAPIPVAAAMRRTLSKGYTLSDLRADVFAGAVVAIVALPLSMALAIAVGAPPEHGLYTTIIAGIIVPLLGGSKHQVTGPTAAFVVILAPIVTKYGLGGLLTAGLMAGVLLVLMGIARVGKLIEFIPHPVTTGFTSGIAVVIAGLQLKDCFGLRIDHMPDAFIARLGAMWAARSTVSIAEVVIAGVTFAMLLLVGRVTKRLPAPLVAITVVSVLAAIASRLFPQIHIATIGTRFGGIIHGVSYTGIPPVPPLPILPWQGDGLTFSQVRELGGAAFAIAVLGAIESLLSAVIADGVTGKKHDPDAELVGLGVGNVVAPFFGGIAATGALARTATNIRAGATSPIACVAHAIFVLLAVLVGAKLVAYVPMASLSALLVLVAWNMSEVRHFGHTLRVAPRSDIIVLLLCFTLTIVFDMVIAVSVGVVFAALLFMQRMSQMTRSRLLSTAEVDTQRRVDTSIAIYEIAGPLFFGAAQRAMSALEISGEGIRAVVLALGGVPVIDATGLVALESAIERVGRAKKLIIITGPLPEPRQVFVRANLEVANDHVFFADTLDEGIQLAKDLILLTPVAKPA